MTPEQRAREMLGPRDRFALFLAEGSIERDTRLYDLTDEEIDRLAAALSREEAVRAEEWRPIAEVIADPLYHAGELLGWADGCGYETVRVHSDGHIYAGAFSADWVKWVRPLPAPPSIRSSPSGEG